MDQAVEQGFEIAKLRVQSYLRERDDLVALLRELIDIEGPQPGHVMWARKVQDALAKIAL